LFLDWRARGGSARLLLAVAAFSAGMGNHVTLIGVVLRAVLYVVLRDRRVLTRVCGRDGGSGAARRRRNTADHPAHPSERAVPRERSPQCLRARHVVTAQRFAEKRFAFTASQLVTDHLPAMLGVIGRELGVAGSCC
jgi:hypothetical protein